MKKRSGFSVMVSLIGLIKPLAGYMAAAITAGTAGHLCAAFITIFGGYAVLHILQLPAPLSLTALFVLVCVFAALRGILRYAEQSCNHYIAFKLLALIRDKVFRALRRLSSTKPLSSPDLARNWLPDSPLRLEISRGMKTPTER